MGERDRTTDQQSIYMSKQLITIALFAAIFLINASFTIAQSTRQKTEPKSAEQKASVDVDDEAQVQKGILLGDLSALDIDQ